MKIYPQRIAPKHIDEYNIGDYIECAFNPNGRNMNILNKGEVVKIIDIKSLNDNNLYIKIEGFWYNIYYFVVKATDED